MKKNKDCAVKGYLTDSIFSVLLDNVNTLGKSQSQFVTEAVTEKLLAEQEKVSQVKLLQNRQFQAAH